MIDFDDKTVCPNCAVPVRTLALDSHMRSNRCIGRTAMLESARGGLLPIPPEGQPARWALRMLDQLNIAVHNGPVGVTQTSFRPQIVYGYLAAEWVVYLLRAYRYSLEGGPLVTRALAAFRKQPDQQATVISLARLGSDKAVRHYVMSELQG